MLDKINKNVSIYQKALDSSWLKNTAISNNIANVNTPGYKRQDVKFDAILKNYVSDNSMELKRTHPKHISNNDFNSLQPVITRESGTSFRKDKNNVDIDVEMAELSKNAIKFNALAQDLSRYLNRIKKAISEGGR